MKNRIVNIGALLRAGHRAPECWGGKWSSAKDAPEVSFMQNPDHPGVLLYRLARNDDFSWALKVGPLGNSPVTIVVIHGSLNVELEFLIAGQMVCGLSPLEQIDMDVHFDHLQPPEHCYFLVM